MASHLHNWLRTYEERHEKEGNIILPADSSVGRQVYRGNDITVTVRLVGDEKFAGVDSVVDVPSAAAQ